MQASQSTDDFIGEYLSMQRLQYQRRAESAMVSKDGIQFEAVVGSYDEQEKFPYDENILKHFNGDTKISTILEYGCGPGRNLLRLARKFKRVIGVDISEKNLHNARQFLTLNGIKDFDLILTPGDSISTLEKFDVVFEVICLQHICSYSIRKRILHDMYDVCKRGGLVVCQFGFNDKTLPRSNYNTRFYAGYCEDQFAGIEDTNGASDCCVTDSKQLIEDFQDIGLKDIETWHTGTVNDVNHDSWIWISGRK